MTADVAVPWRKDEPRLTRAALEELIFPLTTWTRRGYDQAAVDAFAAQVARELELLATEKTALWQALEDLRGRFIRGEDPGDLPAGTREARERAVAMVSAAQVAADRYVGAAKEQAARISQTARSQLADAEQRAARMIRQADEYAAQVRQEAEERARDAASAALDIPVGADAEQALRAARASDAYMTAYNGVHLVGLRGVLEAGRTVLEAGTRMIDDLERKEDERSGPERARPLTVPGPSRRTET